MRRAWLLVAAALAGCIAPSPPSEPDLARPSTPKPAAPSLPVSAEVEMGGIIRLPPHVKGDATIWIADGPCWQPGTRAFGTTQSHADKWFFEVFVPQGTQLWICGSVGDPSKPLEIYGQAEQAPLLGKGTGEVPFMNLVIPLAKGKKVSAPPKR